MLEIRGLNFAYKKGNNKFQVFTDLDVTFSTGINIILGPNGAGKTTLLKSIFGLLEYEGQIFYKDLNITDMETEEKTKLIAYLPQMDISSSMLTVFEMVLLGRLPELGYKISKEDLQAVSNTLESLNISSLSGRNFNELSGGQKKMVFIAQTLVREPRIMLMDEPANSLDLQKQLELCRLLQNISAIRSVDIIMVMHDINMASRYADHIAVIDSHGHLHSLGNPGDVITEKMLREVYGVIADVNLNSEGKPVISPLCSARDKIQT